MIDAPPAAPTATTPDWDPGPRKPRRTRTYLAAVFLLLGAAYGYHGSSRTFGSPYPVREGACSALELAPLTTALGALELSGEPDVTTRKERAAAATCSFRSSGGERFPRIRGELAITWDGSAVESELRCAMAGTEESLSDPVTTTAISGLGKRAFAETERMSHLSGWRMSVTVCDGNAVLRMFVLASDDDSAEDEMRSVLTEVARTALERIG